MDMIVESGIRTTPCSPSGLPIILGPARQQIPFFGPGTICSSKANQTLVKWEALVICFKVGCADPKTQKRKQGAKPSDLKVWIQIEGKMEARASRMFASEDCVCYLHHRLKSTSWNHEFHRHTTTQSPQNQRLERTLQSPNGSPRRMSPSRKAQCRFFFSGHHTLKTLISWCHSVNKKRQDPIKLSSCYVQGPRYFFFFSFCLVYLHILQIMPNIESTFSMCLCLSELLEYLLQSSVKEYQVVALSADLLVSINIDGYDRAT